MAKRKSVDVSFVMEKANHYLAYDSPQITPDMRRGVACLLEVVLHETGQYRGYGYLPGHEPYIYGADGRITDQRNPRADDSRRRYIAE